MATNSKTVKPSFYEVVFQGKPKAVRAFMGGLNMGLDGEHTIFYSFQESVSHEGKAERLAELVGVRATDCHVIVAAAISARLKQLKKRIGQETGLEITAHRRISSGSLKFSFEAFAPRYNDEIMKVLKKLPAGLKLQDFEHDVNIDPAAEGVEAYAVAHHYEASCQGRITGRIDLLIELKRTLDAYPLVKDEDILLKLA